MRSCWKLGSKVIGSAISAIEKRTGKIVEGSKVLEQSFVKEIFPAAAKFDEIVLRGATAKDAQQIIRVRDKGGTLLGEFIEKIKDGLRTSTLRQYAGDFASGRHMMEMQKVNQQVVSTTTQTIQKLPNGVISRSGTQTLTNADGTQTCRSLLGGFSKQDKKVVKFDYLRDAEGYIKNGSLKISEGAELIRDVPKEYLPLTTNNNNITLVKDALDIQLRKRKISARPQLSFVDDIPRNFGSDVTSYGGCAVLGTAYRPDVLNNLFLQGKLQDAFYEFSRIGTPHLFFKDIFASPESILEFTAHEVDHLKRWANEFITKENRQIVAEEARAWWEKATSKLSKKQFDKHPQAAKRQQSYIESLVEEFRDGFRNFRKQCYQAHFKDKWMDFWPQEAVFYPKEMSYNEYLNLPAEKIAFEKGIKEKNFFITHVLKPIQERIYGINA